MTAETPRYRYRLDANDIFVSVDDLWLAFAKENGARHLTREIVLGRSIWDFVASDELRALYKALHSRIRQGGPPVVVPFRCDSPSLQRHMRLKIACEAGGALAYESLLVRAVPQRNLQVLDSKRQRSDAFLTICSCCKRALLEPVGWIELEDASVRLKLFEAQQVPELRHTVCPKCVSTFEIASGNGSAA